MDPLHHAPDNAHREHLAEARRVLALPLDVSRLHWHPFGVYAVPLAPRTRDGLRWSRRLHVWHPDAVPVGEGSPYGVHTHTGTGTSHVLLGALRHHLYAFEDHPAGPWQRTSPHDTSPARPLGHIKGTTPAGMTHTFPADHPHGVTKPPGLAISLFEQASEGRPHAFTTWQRTDVPPEEPVRTPPIPLRQVVAEALAAIENRLADPPAHETPSEAIKSPRRLADA